MDLSNHLFPYLGCRLVARLGTAGFRELQTVGLVRWWWWFGHRAERRPRAVGFRVDSYKLRQAAARTAFEVEQRIADENSARDGQYAAEGDQIRSVELQEQLEQMLAPAALPPP